MIQLNIRRVAGRLAAICLLGIPSLSIARGDQAQMRRAAPDFTLPAADGKIVRLADWKGSAILLEFFQTGCANCQIAAPMLEFLYQKYKSQGLVVAAVSFDAPTGSLAERIKAVTPFVRQHRLTHPVLLGDGAIWKNYIQRPGFNSPMIFFIDRKGQIVAQIEEGPDHKAHDPVFLENQVKQLLK